MQCRWKGLSYFIRAVGDFFSCENSLGKGSRGGNCLLGRSLQFLAWHKQDRVSLSRCRVLSVLKQ